MIEKGEEMNYPIRKMITALKDGKTVSVSEVESGLECGCVCPACGEFLVAKKGKIRVHHFAHQSGRDCEYGYETSLHLLAKKIFLKAKRFKTPPVFIDYPNPHKEKELLFPERIIQIDEVKLEKRYNDVIPDIVLVCGEKELFVEIFVCHKINDAKLERIKSNNISTIEINLSKLKESVTEEQIEEILLEGTDYKVWVYNAEAAKELKQRCLEADAKKIVPNDIDEFVENCPISKRVSWDKDPYAYYKEDCQKCEYCISYENNVVLCVGEKKSSEETAVAYKCPRCGDELQKIILPPQDQFKLKCRNTSRDCPCVLLDERGRLPYSRYEQIVKTNSFC